MEVVRKNKVFLINTLSTEAKIVLQYVQSDKIITSRDYNNLKHPNHTQEDIIINLLDNLMRKGDEACHKFLNLLQHKQELQEIFPRLKDLFTPAQTSHEKDSPAMAIDEIGKYKMSSKPCGFCLIINNMKFASLSYRDGSEVDEGSLKGVFEWLGFTVDVHRDQTAEEMKVLLRTYSQKHHEGDCFVCCILSHGTTEGVYGTDKGIIPGDDIFGPFSGTSCQSLINKPKMFFIQACRGEKYHTAVEVQSDGDKEEQAGEEEKETFEMDGVQMITIPADADFLVARSTVKGYYSFRNRTSGSWFIQSLCEQLKKYCPE